jgi:hypothetical protein
VPEVTLPRVLYRTTPCVGVMSDYKNKCQLNIEVDASPVISRMHTFLASF